MREEIEKLIDYVLAADRRKAVLLALDEKTIARQVELADRLKVSSFFVFKAIHELEDKKLVKALEPERKTWKKYKITKLGKQVVKNIQELIHQE